MREPRSSNEDFGLLDFNSDLLSSSPTSFNDFVGMDKFRDELSSVLLPKTGLVTPGHPNLGESEDDWTTSSFLSSNGSGGPPVESRQHLGTPPPALRERITAFVPSQMSPLAGFNSFDTSAIAAPEISFLHQPVQRFRFRYLSEEGSHGQLLARNSTPQRHCCPTVEIKNTTGDVELRVSLYTVHDHRIHELLRFHQVTEGRGAQRGRRSLKDLKLEMKFVKLEQNSRLVELRGLGITRLTKDDLQNTGKTLEEAQAMQRLFNKFDTCLRVAAYQGERLVAGPIFSEGISKLRCTSQLKIQRRSLWNTSACGGQELWLLTDRVKKNDIEVRVTDDEDWEGVCTGVEVFHQFIIICRTPPYPGKLNSSGRSMKLYLHRPSDEAVSDSYDIHYLPERPAAESSSPFEARKRKKTSFEEDFEKVVNPQLQGSQQQDLATPADMARSQTSDLSSISPQTRMKNVRDSEPQCYSVQSSPLAQTVPSPYSNSQGFASQSQVQEFALLTCRRSPSSQSYSPASYSLDSGLPCFGTEQSPLSTQARSPFQNDLLAQSISNSPVSTEVHYQSIHRTSLQRELSLCDASSVSSFWHQAQPLAQPQLHQTSGYLPGRPTPSHHSSMSSPLGSTAMETPLGDIGDIDIEELLRFEPFPESPATNNSWTLVVDSANKPDARKSQKPTTHRKEDDEKRYKEHETSRRERASMDNGVTRFGRPSKGWHSGSQTSARSRRPFDINQINGDGETFLHHAIRKDDDVAVAFLLTHGADANLQSRLSGDSPLHLAVKYDSPSVLIQLLKEVDLDFGLRNDAGQSFLDLLETDSRVFYFFEQDERTQDMVELSHGTKPELWEDAVDSFEPLNDPPHCKKEEPTISSGKEAEEVCQEQMRMADASKEPELRATDGVPQISVWWYIFLPLFLAYCYSVMFCWF